AGLTRAAAAAGLAGRVRPGASIAVRATDEGFATDLGPVTSFDIVSPDMPYLVESVRAELEHRGHTVLTLVHPALIVERDAEGVLTEVHDLADTAPLPDGAITESWIHVEIPAVDPDTAATVAERLHTALVDVSQAVTDASPMYAAMRTLADHLVEDPGNFDRDTSAEAGQLLRWLADGNYLIVGHAAFTATELGADPSSSPRTSGEGVLRPGGAVISPSELLPAFRSGNPLVIFKSPLVSRIRRAAHYDCVTVVDPADGRLHVFLGLIVDRADYTLGQVPVVRQRIAEIMATSGVRADSHSGRRLAAAVRTLPRDEMLEAPTPDLLRLAQLVVDRADHGGVGVFARVHLNHDFVSVLVYLPADRFGPETRRRVCEIIARNWPGTAIGRDDRITELDLARMQFLIALRPGEEIPNPERSTVENEVQAVIRRWSDDLADLLTLAVGEERAEGIVQRFVVGLPEAYKEDFAPSTAVTDLVQLAQLPADDGLAFSLYRPPADDPADRRLKVFRTGATLSLARALPMFTDTGFEVLDERPYEIGLAGGGSAWVYDFGLRLPAGVPLDDRSAHELVETLALLWRGRVEQDGFNALVVRAGLTWRQADVLRTYAKYLRQANIAGVSFSQGYLERTLAEHPAIARLLVEFFQERFDPSLVGVSRPDDQASTEDRIAEALADVASLDQDRILRTFAGLIAATTRTNAYRRDPAGERRAAIAIKLAPHRIEGLPLPKPWAEVWVHSPRVEGVHLRFGPVARGGLRWSDRPEDFRTEVLGLVKAQMVKNAVIVPVGAKGGFVAKRLPDATNRDAWLAEGRAAYREFVSSLLDVTDNDVLSADGTARVVPPERVVRHDGDDAYLVVAADKGTATFSDLANEVSHEYGFWLGDAFASGGSVGYDHKAMGITARGAWESVTYHFREMGVDVARDPVTVVGIGDMSGDVFGNGMLQSRALKLVAAFDHRHIFLDPNPDPAASFAERQRLFALPRSSWADYDQALISAGGGVFPRTLKAIPVSAEVRAVLGLGPQAVSLSPAELLHALLVAPVDLLWNGGIGTYVKASDEPQGAAGDKANDVLRADGRDVRAKVVGEGGNLGLTQLGRIEYALHGGPEGAGGRINTDAIDNSAGVDTSDHEVNIKILLDRAVASGALPAAERNPLLLDQVDVVAKQVLADNYGQNVLLGVSRSTAPALIGVHARLLRELESTGELDRALEFLPDDAELTERAEAGQGLTSPELSVVVAYVKNGLTRRLIATSLPEEPWFHRALVGYFPAEIVERLRPQLAGHPLRREIITTAVVNDCVNRAGTTFVFRAVEETGAPAEQVLKAYTVAREVFDLESFWADVEALDHTVSTDAQVAALRWIRRVIDRATRWLLDSRFPIADVTAEISRFRPAVAALLPHVHELVCGVEREALDADSASLVAAGLPTDLAHRVSALLSGFLLLDVVEIAQAENEPVEAVAALHFALSEHFHVDALLTRITGLDRRDRWHALARSALRHDLYAALSSLTRTVLRGSDPTAPATERMQTWAAANTERVERALVTLDSALASEPAAGDLAVLSVALRVLRGLPT
ncbi:NAD-glutamate dehydrogenase, partial [Jatrophihabitans sp. YIM 134969]